MQDNIVCQRERMVPGMRWERVGFMVAGESGPKFANLFEEMKQDVKNLENAKKL